MRSKICASSFCIQGNKMWMVPIEYPYIFCIDIESGTIVFKYRLKDFNNYTANRGYFLKLVDYGKNMYGIPYWSDYAFKFCIESKSVSYFPLSEQDDKNGSGYYASALLGNKLFSFLRTAHPDPDRNGKILIFDIEDDKLEIIDDETNIINKDLPVISSVVRRDMFLGDGKAFFLSGEKVIELKADGSLKEYRLNNKCIPFTTICGFNDDGEFCMTDKRGNVYIWDKERGSINRIGQFTDNRCTKEYINSNTFYEPFGYSIKYNDKVILMPYMMDSIIEIDINNLEIKEAPYSKKLCYEPEKIEETEIRNCCGQFSEPCIVENKLYVWNMWTQAFYIVDLLTDITEKMDYFVDFSRSECAKEMRRNISKGSIIQEDKQNYFFSLEGFIRGI